MHDLVVERYPSSGGGVDQPIVAPRCTTCEVCGADHRGHVEAVGIFRARCALAEKVTPSDRFLERTEAQARQDLTHLLGQVAEEGHDHLGLATKLGPQVEALGGNTDGTGVVMAGPGHDTAFGYQGRRTERVFVGTEEGRNNYVAPGLHPAISTQAHPVAQPIQHQGLLSLGQAKLPGHTHMLDTAQRCGSGTTCVATDQDGISVALGYSRSDRAHTSCCDEFDTHPRTRVGLLQIVDQLGEILDTVDIMVWWWADQGYPWHGMADTGDLLIHLMPRELAPFTRLSPLGHLDLQFDRIRQVGWCHPEAT